MTALLLKDYLILAQFLWILVLQGLGHIWYGWLLANICFYSLSPVLLFIYCWLYLFLFLCPKESFLSFVFLLSSHWQFYLHTISFPKLSAVRCSWTYLTAINWAKSVISELTKNWQDAKTVQIDEICPHSKPFHCK